MRAGNRALTRRNGLGKDRTLVSRFTAPSSLLGVYSNHHFIHLDCHITKIKVFYRLSIRGKHIFPRAWNTLTKSVGKQVASGVASLFLGLQNLGFVFLHLTVIR
jgi:hypothetical protein